MTEPGLWDRYGDAVLCALMLLGFAVAIITVLVR